MTTMNRQQAVEVLEHWRTTGPVEIVDGKEYVLVPAEAIAALRDEAAQGNPCDGGLNMSDLKTLHSLILDGDLTDAARLCDKLLAQQEAALRDEAGAVDACYQAYQAVGVLLTDTGQFDTPHGQKLLDNLSQARVVHDDVLPWASVEKPNPEGGVTESEIQRIHKAMEGGYTIGKLRAALAAKPTKKEPTMKDELLALAAKWEREWPHYDPDCFDEYDLADCAARAVMGCVRELRALAAQPAKMAAWTSEQIFAAAVAADLSDNSVQDLIAALTAAQQEKGNG